LVAVVRIVLLAEAHARADPVERRRDHAVVGRVIDLVSRKLFNDELVVRLVLVERLDQVIAIPPRGFEVSVVLVAGTVGVAGHIHPMPRVPLAVVLGSQRTYNYLLPGLGGLVIQKSVQLSRRRQKEN